MNDATKPLWNSLEIAKLSVSTMTPLLLFGLGLAVSHYNKEQQKRFDAERNHSQEQKEQAEAGKRKADADEARDRDITKEYIRLMASSTPCASDTVIPLLLTFSTPQHAENLKKNFLSKCGSASNIQELAAAATAATAESVANELASLMKDLKTDGRHVARSRLKRLFISNPEEVSTTFIDAIRTEKHDYRTGIGILSVLDDPGVAQLAPAALYRAVEELRSSSSAKDPTFQKLLQSTLVNR